MAAKVEGSDFTSCPICLETYNVPKTLPCLHTICESCIESHITSTTTGVENEKFSCPVCQTTVFAPYKGCSPQQWALDLPINNLVVGLMEQRKLEHEEKKCMSCERLGNTSFASFICVECSDVLCESCQQCHKANKFTSKHKIVSVGNISEVEKSLDLFRNECTEHKEDVKLYCDDHDVPCCSLCASVEHRKCQKVVTITKAAKGFINSGQPKELQISLADIEDDAKIVCDHNKTCKEELNTQYNKALKKVDNYFDTLKNRIDSMKVKRKNELEKILYKNQEETQKNVQMLENLKRKTSNEREILDVSLSKATEVQALIETKRVQGKKDSHVEALVQAVQNTFDYEMGFHPSISIDECIKFINDKCIIENSKKSVSLNLKSVPPSKLQLKSRINTRYHVKACICKEDGTICVLQNIQYQDTVTLFDLNGTRITSFIPQDSITERGRAVQKRRRKIHLDKTAIAGNNTEIVYISNSGCLIQFIDYNGHNKSYINVNCSGFTDMVYSNIGLVVVLFQNRIDILGKDGAVMTSFQAVNPQHPCINIHSHLLYVEKGVIRSKYLDGKNFDILPLEVGDIGGMVVDGKGNIFVSFPRRNTVSRVVRKTGSITDVLGPDDGLMNPSRLCVSADGKFLCVVMNNSYDRNEALLFRYI